MKNSEKNSQRDGGGVLATTTTHHLSPKKEKGKKEKSVNHSKNLSIAPLGERILKTLLMRDLQAGRSLSLPSSYVPESGISPASVQHAQG